MSEQPQLVARSGSLTRALACSLIALQIFVCEPASSKDNDSPIARSSVKRRFLTIEDPYRLEGFANPAFSHDGQYLAFTRIRPSSTEKMVLETVLERRSPGDVWFKEVRGNPARSLTDGQKDGTGWWAPQWSPDGRHLLMLSTRSPNNTPGGVWLWVWERQSGILRSLSDRAIDVSPFDGDDKACEWIDSRRLICQMLQQGARSDDFHATPVRAPLEWQVASQGKLAVSVLDNASDTDPRLKPQASLVTIDLTTDAMHEVARYPVATQSIGGVGNLWELSPDQRFVALTSQILANNYGDPTIRYSVDVYELNGQHRLSSPSLPGGVYPGSVRWTPESDRIAFVGHKATGFKSPALYETIIKTGQTREVDLHNLELALDVGTPAPLEYTKRVGLMVRAAKAAAGQGPVVDARRDWWLIGPGGEQRNLTGNLHEVPDRWWHSANRGVYLTLADQQLWTLRPQEGRLRGVDLPSNISFQKIVWPENDSCNSIKECAHGVRDSATLIVSATDSKLYRWDPNNGAPVSLRDLPAKSTLIGYSPRNEALLSYRSDSSGLQVGLNTRDAPNEELVVNANGFLKEIADLTFQPFHYAGLDGQALTGWLILPPGYQAGRAYRAITWVYPGTVYDDQHPPNDQLELSLSVRVPLPFISPFNMQIPAAQGYVIVLPSMPLAPIGTVDDPMLRLKNGVLPAVDQVVKLGIVDPKRVYLLGHSFGGYGTLGLLTQTTRFAAAAAVAGMSDFTAGYGELPSCARYSDVAAELTFTPGYFEGTQGHMGVPPWADSARYVRNSPVYFADRVQTPLLILHGDLDCSAPIEGSEEFFTALNRQNKRVRFVRYWGMGHDFQSQIAATDMWRRIYEWFSADESISGPPN